MPSKRGSSDAEPWMAGATAAAGSVTSSRKEPMPAPEKPKAPSLSHSSSFRGSAPGGSDQQLFQTPSDLVCPITLTLLQDPVINSLGQVYERSAIQRHLIQAALNGQPPTDPVSNAILPSLDLVPVFPMRSRAAEYRETTARTCMQAAASPDCQSPVRYLRRAAELVLSTADAGSSPRSGSSTLTSAGGHWPPSPAAAAAAVVATAAATGGRGSLALSIPGMTLDFARYLAAHQGSAYDALVLKYFGNELLRAGCADAAADVFYRLLLEAEERVQQAEYLQLCLDCWTSSSSSSSSSGSSSSSSSEGGTAEVPRTSVDGVTAPVAAAPAGSEQQQQQQQMAAECGSSADTAEQQQIAPAPMQLQPPPAAAPISPVIIGKLADFVQRQDSLSPSTIIHMLQSMTHGPAMALQLCQVLLARAGAAAAEAGPCSESEVALCLPGGLGGALQVLLALVELSSGQLKEQLNLVTTQIQALQQQQQQQDKGGWGSSTAAAAAAAASQGAGGSEEPAAAAAAARGGGSDTGNKDGSGRQTGNRRSRRAAHRWFGGKGSEVLMGRVVRGAAAGTLAVASLFGGNHPLWKLARVGPLMYLLRAGL